MLIYSRSPISFFFFFNDTATTEIYTLSLHDALPIWPADNSAITTLGTAGTGYRQNLVRSEEHTSELQSRRDLVCRLLLEKKKKLKITIILYIKQEISLRLMLVILCSPFVSTVIYRPY